MQLLFLLLLLIIFLCCCKKQFKRKKFIFKNKKSRLIAADLCKQKTLYADSRAIQQKIFTGKIKLTVANTRLIIYYILEQSKEKILHFSKGTPKVL